MSTARTQRVRASHTRAPLTPNVSDVEEWVGSAEIAVLLGGISRQRVQQLTSRPDFPEPMVRLKQGAVWRTADVVRWAESRGREIHE